MKEVQLRPGPHCDTQRGIERRSVLCSRSSRQGKQLRIRRGDVLSSLRCQACENGRNSRAARAHPLDTKHKSVGLMLRFATLRVEVGGWPRRHRGRCVCVVSYTSGGSLLQVWMTSRWQGSKGRKGSRSCRRRRHESDRQALQMGCAEIPCN